MSIPQEKLDRLATMSLDHSAHITFDDGHCPMELVAWLNGENHGDSPACTDPAIATFVRHWSDSMGQDDRDKFIRPLLIRLVGTASTDEIRDQRSLMALDWSIRESTPAWLELNTDLMVHAGKLRDLPEILGRKQAWGCVEVVRAARDAARSAASSPADSAASSAAHSAASSAARSAASYAAHSAARFAASSAAYSAARSAAYYAASSAAYYAAGSAANYAASSAGLNGIDIQPATMSLQASAARLLDRMISATE